MSDFRLLVFETLARRLNFTRAAEELFITQPAVTKHIRALEEQYNTRLLERSGSRISLTPSGKILLDYATEILNLYRRAQEDLAAQSQQLQGSIRLGASTTVAQYVLPSYLAAFRKKFPTIRLSLSSGNTERIEYLLLKKELDFGIVEGQSQRKQLQYVPFLKDEIVLCTRAGNPAYEPSISIKKLLTLPMLLREPGSGSREVIAAALHDHGISLANLQTEMDLHSTESMKRYLLHSDAFAFISVHAIRQELAQNLLAIANIRQLTINRNFHFVHLQGGQYPLASTLMQFLKRG